MKIKLDENLPRRLGSLLTELNHDVHTPFDEDLVGHSDKKIWETAQEESRFLITQDLDFSESRKFTPGLHHGILPIRLHSPNRKNLIERVIELFREENVEEWAGWFVVATDRKLRIQKPASKEKS